MYAINCVSVSLKVEQILSKKIVYEVGNLIIFKPVLAAGMHLVSLSVTSICRCVCVCACVRACVRACVCVPLTALIICGLV